MKTIIHEPHPAFLDSAKRHLSIETEDIESLIRFQRYKIRRDPRNLTNHVQTIFSLIKQENVQRRLISASLADLYIILGNNGLALRERMLAIAKPYLQTEEIVFFKKHLTQSLDEKTPLPFDCPSSLTKAFSGQSTHIKKIEETFATAELSEYEIALDLIDSGDLERAIGILQKLLYQNPSSAQIAEDLVSTARHAQQEQMLVEIQNWFIENNHELPDCWPLL